jgi:hypothetical protein
MTDSRAMLDSLNFKKTGITEGQEDSCMVMTKS